MGSNEAQWDALMAEGGGQPVDRILALLRERGPLTAAEIADATGYQVGNVGQFILQARSQGHRITARYDAGGTTYALLEEKP